MKEFEFKFTLTYKETEELSKDMSHVDMPDSSMKPRIRKGDKVIYNKNRKEIFQEPTPIVVKLNGETLVREGIQDSSGVITLRSCSRKIPTITVSEDDDLEILGRFYGVMRIPQGKDRSHAVLMTYPQPKKRIDYDPMGFGGSGPDAYDSLPPIGSLAEDTHFTEEEKRLINMSPAVYTVAKYLRDAPQEAIKRFVMPDESMMDLIDPGDVIFCDCRLKEPDPKYALLFVVKINGEATVREVWHDKLGNIRIRPLEPSFPAYIIEDGDDFEIVGKLISAIELSLRYSEDGEEMNHMMMKLLPPPRIISASEP